MRFQRLVRKYSVILIHYFIYLIIIIHFVHQRLVEIFGRDEPFGGIPAIVLGDLQQLPSVGGGNVFQLFDAKNNESVQLFPQNVSNLWSNFEFFQLTEVMRQKRLERKLIS